MVDASIRGILDTNLIREEEGMFLRIEFQEDFFTRGRNYLLKIIMSYRILFDVLTSLFLLFFRTSLKKYRCSEEKKFKLETNSI